MIASTLDDRAAFDATLPALQAPLLLAADDTRARVAMAACRASGQSQGECDAQIRESLVNGRSCPPGQNVVREVVDGQKVRTCRAPSVTSADKAAILLAEARARAGSPSSARSIVIVGLAAAVAYALLKE